MTSMIPVLNREDGSFVDGLLIESMTESQVKEADHLWWRETQNYLAKLVDAKTPTDRMPQHGHWSWAKKYSYTAGQLSYRYLGIEVEGIIQGMVLLNLDGEVSKHPDTLGQPLVKIEFLSTAPWNCGLFCSAPKYGLIGQTLISASIQVSMELGFKGRVALTALPQSEGWYRSKCGMTDLGIDKNPKAQGLRYFEMTSEQANEFIR